MPTLTVAEERFVQRWRRIDFAEWSEADVREGFVGDLLDTLGYHNNPSYDFPEELLPETGPSVAKRHFWLIDVRPGTPREIVRFDVLPLRNRAFSPAVRARFVVLTNGWQVRVYDALTMSDFDDALLIVNQLDGSESVAGLRDAIGSTKMLELHRARMLDIVHSTLCAESDTMEFDEQASMLREIVTEARRVVRQNARVLKAPGWREQLTEEDAALFSMSPEMLFVRMDLPWDGRPPATREFVRRVLQATPQEQTRLIDLLVLEYRARPHNVFRVQALHALVSLMHGGVEVGASPHVKSIADCINELALQNMSYWSPHSLPPVCHLDNVACRVATKLCLRVGTAQLKQVLGLGSRPTATTLAERGSSAPQLDTPGQETAAHLHELLWRWSNRAQSREEMLHGIWDLHAIEAELDRLPPRSGARSLDFQGHQFMGLSWDQLRIGTANVLRDGPGLPTLAGIDPRVVEFARKTRREVTDGIPAEPQAPAGRRPARLLTDALDSLAEAVRIRMAETASGRW